MLSYLTKTLSKIDQFGVPFQQKLKHTTDEFKSAIGGLASLIIYSLSLAYLIYSLTQWGQGQILPKITTIFEKADSQQIIFKDVIMEFKIRQDYPNQINPFDMSNLIFLPLVVPFRNNQISSSDNFFNLTQIQFSQVAINISNIELHYGDDDLEYIIAFVECTSQSQQYLPTGGIQCANQTYKDQYFNQVSNAMIITTFVNQFNTNSQNLESVGKEQVIAITNDSTYFQTTNFNIQEAAVDTGFLFENIESYLYAQDYYLTSQQLSLSYLSKLFKVNTYIGIQARLGKLKNFQSIQYPKISEILADAGSIASTLLILSYFFIKYNDYLLNEQSISNIISIYYPKYKDLQINYDIIGRITSITQDGKCQDIEQYKLYMKELREIAERKLSLTNLIYEISRLQFLIKGLIKQKDTLISIHQTGIKLKDFELKTNEDNTSLNQIIPCSQLNSSTTHLNAKLKIIQDEEEQLNDNDFTLLVQPDV